MFSAPRTQHGAVNQRDVRARLDQLCGVFFDDLGVAIAEPDFDIQIPAFAPSVALQLFAHRCKPWGRFRIVRSGREQNGNPALPVALRACTKWPRDRNAAEKPEEFPTSHTRPDPIKKVEKKKMFGYDKEELWNTVIKTYPNVSQFWNYDKAAFLKQPVYSRDFPPCKFCD